MYRRLLTHSVGYALSLPKYSISWNSPSDRRDAFQMHLSALDQLKASVETANFATRLKRWAGREAYGEDEEDLTSGEHPHFERELIKLADEAVKNPSLLTPDLVEWLLSSLSQRSRAFFYFLGNADKG